MRGFVRVNQLLDQTRVFPRLLHDCVHSVVFERIRAHVRETCQGDFESKCAASLETWLENTVGAWLQTIAGNCFYRYSSIDRDICRAIPLMKFRISSSRSSSTGPASSAVSTIKQNLLYFLLDIFIDVRAGQLFDMIVDFPDSQPALEDLRDCIAKVWADI